MCIRFLFFFCAFASHWCWLLCSLQLPLCTHFSTLNSFAFDSYFNRNRFVINSVLTIDVRVYTFYSKKWKRNAYNSTQHLNSVCQYMSCRWNATIIKCCWWIFFCGSVRSRCTQNAFEFSINIRFSDHQNGISIIWQWNKFVMVHQLEIKWENGFDFDRFIDNT